MERANDEATTAQARRQGIVVSFQGDAGAFSEAAAIQAFGQNITTNGLPTFKDVFKAVENETKDSAATTSQQYGIIPIENSVSGTFHIIYDHLIKSNLKIVGEVAQVEAHCLCVLPGVSKSDVTNVMSHPVILEQCENYFTNWELRTGVTLSRISSWDSSGACAILKQDDLRSSAAVASTAAATFHGLEILEDGIANELHNETRYLIIAKSDSSPPSSKSSLKLKSSIAIAAPNEPGSLFKIVAAFGLRNLSVLKIESRPASTAAASSSFNNNTFATVSRHWDYIFYIDYEPSTCEITNKRLLENLQEHAMWIRELGCYSQNLVSQQAQEQQPRWTRICNVLSH